MSEVKTGAARFGLDLSDMFPKLGDSQKEQVKAVQQRVGSLKEHMAWADLERIIQKEIAKSTPNVKQFTAEGQSVLASQAVYCTGLRFALEIVQAAYDSTHKV